MPDPTFKEIIPIAVVVTGDVHYSIQRGSTGDYYDGTTFVAPAAGTSPPSFPLPDTAAFPGYRRADVPVPAAVFTPDIYILIIFCLVSGAPVPVSADMWDLRVPDAFPAKLIGWFSTFDRTTNQWTQKYVQGP